jgi:hypothetical protein
MIDSTNYSKTQKGKDALNNRSAALTAKLRSMLLLVDGNKTRATLDSLAGQIGSGSTAIDELEKLGFIAIGANTGDSDSGRAAAGDDDDRTVRVASNSIDRFVQAQRFMLGVLQDAGASESNVAKSIGRASAMPELTAAYEGFVALVEAKRGVEASSIIARLRALLF